MLEEHKTAVQFKDEGEPARVGEIPRVMLVGFQRQGNLGLGYLSAVLRKGGCSVDVLDFEADPADLLKTARTLRPHIIGFSLIFQFYIRRFKASMKYLRENGVCCHFTIGGHYPTLNSRQTLETVEELDSVVRYEGEITLLELVSAIAKNKDWHGISGLAFQRDGTFVETPARKLIHDLDELPYPDRLPNSNMVMGRRLMPILASRGCARTCSFCSIHTFYRNAPGKVVRTRKPARVVEEMLHLHLTYGTNAFLFQDDDFPLYGKVWREWSGNFVDELHKAGLPGRVIWKINCRADAVEPEILARMRDAGLYVVYMGLESGTEEGLRTLNKEITVEQNLRAVAILKELGILFEYGFMLLDPSSTFESVASNISFLRNIVGDGSGAALFCKMLPYDGTPIKAELERTGRLLGDVCTPNYNFLDPRLDDFYEDLARTVEVTGWIHGHKALSNQMNWAWNELAIMRHMLPDLKAMKSYHRQLRSVTRRSNELLFDVVTRLAAYHQDGSATPHDTEKIAQDREAFLEELLAIRNRFVHRNQSALLTAIEAGEARAAA